MKIYWTYNPHLSNSTLLVALLLLPKTHQPVRKHSPHTTSSAPPLPLLGSHRMSPPSILLCSLHFPEAGRAPQLQTGFSTPPLHTPCWKPLISVEEVGTQYGSQLELNPREPTEPTPCDTSLREEFLLLQISYKIDRSIWSQTHKYQYKDKELWKNSVIWHFSTVTF